MKFELTPTDDYTGGVAWDWTVTAKDHGVVARAPELYATEAEARSAIAKARKAMAGAKFAKVEVTELELS